MRQWKKNNHCIIQLFIFIVNFFSTLSLSIPSVSQPSVFISRYLLCIRIYGSSCMYIWCERTKEVKRRVKKIGCTVTWHALSSIALNCLVLVLIFFCYFYFLLIFLFYCFLFLYSFPSGSRLLERFLIHRFDLFLFCYTNETWRFLYYINFTSSQSLWGRWIYFYTCYFFIY